VAPYSLEFADEDKEEWDTGKGLRVMAVAYVPDYSQAASACMVAPNGDCTHYLRLPHLLKRKRSYREAERLQKVLFTNGIRKKLWEKFVMPTTFPHLYVDKTYINRCCLLLLLWPAYLLSLTLQPYTTHKCSSMLFSA
jgi:glutaredoxin-related protein